MSTEDAGPSTDTALTDELSKSLDSAFDFSSASVSPLPIVRRHPPFSPDLLASTSSPSSSSSRGSLVTQHRALETSTGAPKKNSKDILLLEAFLEDNTPVKLSNIPMRHSSASLLQKAPTPSPPPAPKSPLALLSRKDDGSLVYAITPSDTLEGLALKFGVSVAELKKANRLFNARDFGIRKTFVIPITEEHYIKFMTEQENQVRREQERRTEVKQLFMEQLKVDEDVAAVYLDHTHYNLERALERYQLENSTTTEPLNTRSKASSKPVFANGFQQSPSDGPRSTIERATISHQMAEDHLFDL